MSKLYVLSGPEKGDVRDLNEDVTRIGRSPDNDIQIIDSSVSRNHLEIRKKANRYFVIDLGSTNGSFFQGVKLTPQVEVEVKDGQPICIGQIVCSLEEPYTGDLSAVQKAAEPSSELVETGKFDRPIAPFKNLELLYKVAHILMESLDLNEILEKILGYTFDFLKRINRGAIVLVNEETGTISEVISKTRESNHTTNMIYSRTIVERVIREGRPIIMSDTVNEDKTDLSNSLEVMNVRSILCVPLISKSKIRGVIYVDSLRKPYGFRNEDLTILTALSSPAAIAIENALLYTKAKQAEEALKRARDKLEEQVKKRNEELIKANSLLKQEIIDRKQAEKTLQESEQKYRNLFENADDAIFIAQDEVIKFPNPKTEEITGYSGEELANIPFINLIHPEDKEMVLERHKKRLAGESSSNPYSFRIINRVRKEFWVQLNVVRITWDRRPATLNFLRDITQQKKLEEQFQQAQRMEAIGTLAGGIAHDFNNLLMAIQGRATLMMMDTPGSHPHLKHLKCIEESVNSATTLTKQLLGFARGSKYQLKPVNPNEIVAKIADLFGRTKKEITIRSRFDRDVGIVDVDPVQIEQVLLNLYVNAWHAMPGGGELRLETKKVTLDRNFVKPFLVRPGKYVKMSVADTGVGMDEETRRRVFEPFFTTKALGRGTGLGLASAYSIIKNHGGIINVLSEQGRGSVFDIYLPASERNIDEQVDVPEEVIMGKETVLLVDDEEMIRQVGKEMLEKLGYKVLIAESGKDAVEVYDKKKDRIDMVILDLIMPDVGGGETYSRLKAINPDVKVLLSSGYSINDRPREIMDQGCNGFVQKPFNINDLSRKIYEILN